MSGSFKKLEEEYNDCWIYMLLLNTLTILIQSVKSYQFSVSNYYISYSMLLLPFTFFLSNYICKKYDYKKAIASIAMSGVVFTSYVIITSYSLGRGIYISNIVGDFFGYVMSQFVNLLIYDFLLHNTESPWFLIFLNYLFSIIIYYMIYTLVYLNLVIQDGYWMKYLITMGFEFIIAFFTSIFDKKIKRGR